MICRSKAKENAVWALSKWLGLGQLVKSLSYLTETSSTATMNWKTMECPSWPLVHWGLTGREETDSSNAVPDEPNICKLAFAKIAKCGVLESIAQISRHCVQKPFSQAHALLTWNPKVVSNLIELQFLSNLSSMLVKYQMQSCKSCLSCGDQEGCSR